MAKANLSFQLPTLEEVIEPNLLTICPETFVVDAIARMNQPENSSLYQNTTQNPTFSRSSCILVLDQSKLAGIVTEQDIVKLSAALVDLKKVTVKQVMTPEVITLKKTDFQDIYQIMSIMRQYQIQHLPIVDARRQLEGLISSESIYRALNPSNLLRLRSVKETMHTEVLRASPSASVLYVSQLMAENRQDCVVIVDGLSSPLGEEHPTTCSDETPTIPLGIITQRDILQFQLLGLDLATTTAQTVMSSPLICMKPTDSLIEVQQQMKKMRVRRLVVSGESGELQGIITYQQMLRVFDITELHRVISTLKGELDKQTQHLKQEIQQRKTSEAKLRENQQLLELFVRHAPAAIAMLDCQMRYLGVSDRWIEDYQLEKKDIIGRSHYEVFPEIPQHWRQAHQDCLTGKVAILKSEEDSFMGLDGTVNWLRWEIRPWQDLEGNIGGLLMFSEIISEKKLLEQKVFAEQELAQVTLKSIADAVITTDAEGKVKYINPVAERLTGWQTEEAQGQPVSQVFQIINQSTREPVSNPVDLVLQENRIYELAKDTLLIAKDGTEYAVEDSVAPINNHQGELIGAVIVFRDATIERKIAQKLSWQATHDPLTGLYNRPKFEEQLSLAIKQSQEEQSYHALCYLDLDRFKIVNDSCGHVAGDELLKQVTMLVKQKIRASDIFARLGGDEFGLLLHQCPIEIAQTIANQIRQSIEEFCFSWEEKVFKIGASIGLVAIDSTTGNLTNLINTADAACYIAKEKGRNCVHLYHKQDAIVARQLGERQWVEKLNRALQENGFCLYTQKIVSIQENQNSCHYEILLRLIDESGKLILPGTFLPAAERYGLMAAIDRWVVTNFLAGYEVHCQSRKKPKLEPQNHLYTINLSGESISNQEFCTFLQQEFNRYSISPEIICFEITETVAISNFDNAVNLIKQLKKLGCSVALDDFGSGMSSLNYLKNLPVDYLKIDGSFVKNLNSDRLSYATVEYFHHISEIMNIKTIMEFVEDSAILPSLQQIGINYAQGYGIERPQPLIFA